MTEVILPKTQTLLKIFIKEYDNKIKKIIEELSSVDDGEIENVIDYMNIPPKDKEKKLIYDIKNELNEMSKGECGSKNFILLYLSRLNNYLNTIKNQSKTEKIKEIEDFLLGKLNYLNKEMYKCFSSKIKSDLDKDDYKVYEFNEIMKTLNENMMKNSDYNNTSNNTIKEIKRINYTFEEVKNFIEYFLYESDESDESESDESDES